MGIRKRKIMYIPTGGTIGSSTTTEGPRRADNSTTGRMLQLLTKIPFTEYEIVKAKASGDSSEHPREHIIDIGRTTLKHVDDKDGVLISYGTDTMNLASVTVALMGNEMFKIPVTFFGSMKGFEKKNSDAPKITLSAGLFTAFGNGSGVFAARPEGYIITSRYDRPGSGNWHSRAELQLEAGYFAHVELDKLVDTALNLTFDLKQRKGRNIPAELENLITLQRVVSDGSLDCEDQIVAGGRATFPPFTMRGYRTDRIASFKRQCQRIMERTNTVEYQLSKERVGYEIAREIKNRVGNLQQAGFIVGKILPALACVEYMRRHCLSADTFQNYWKQTLTEFLKEDIPKRSIAQRITDFWEAYSKKPNDDLDFKGILRVEAASDPHLLRKMVEAVPSEDIHGIILKATGASGSRLRDDTNESYRPMLQYCKQQNIPVVLTSGSDGEVTSFEYGPGHEALQEDLCFFAGTMDRDLVEPRIALLYAEANKLFLNTLLETIEYPDVRNKIQRDMYRQLLSGTHYRKAGEGETPDRMLIQQRHGLETRIDLLGGLHTKKAIFAAYMHEMFKRELALPQRVDDILKKEILKMNPNYERQQGYNSSTY